MHMTCQRGAGGCGHEFCWLCRGPWSQHGSHTGGYYSCNKYDQDKVTYDTIDKNDKEATERYMFYFHRYESHKEAMKIAGEQRKSAKDRGISLATYFGVQPSETSFLLKAATQIFNKRRTLQWTYVYGFFLATDNKKEATLKKTEQNLFEYLQENLEKQTNYLSELYEQPLLAEGKDKPKANEILQPQQPQQLAEADIIISLVSGDTPSIPLPSSVVVKPKQQALIGDVDDDLEKKEREKQRHYEEFKEWKSKVTNYTKVCAQFLDNLVEGIATGLTTVATLDDVGAGPKQSATRGLMTNFMSRLK